MWWKVGLILIFVGNILSMILCGMLSLIGFTGLNEAGQIVPLISSEACSSLGMIFFFVLLIVWLVWYYKQGEEKRASIRYFFNKRKIERQLEKELQREDRAQQIELLRLQHQQKQDDDIYEKGLHQVERQKMTPKLRTMIIARDGYRCRMCGRGAADGVKLEVDHKIPIAKGGKTEENNLWTLCFDCNRGKSDKLLDLSEFE